jgi:galactose-1-phosphate uridylyltransferase
MPELRQNFFTKEWVVIATERAKRPEQLIVHRAPKPIPSFSPNCPFCPGNEALTPPEILRLPNGDNSWKIRVIPNKFAALAREGPPARFTVPVAPSRALACTTLSLKLPTTPKPWPACPTLTWPTSSASTKPAMTN